MSIIGGIASGILGLGANLINRNLDRNDSDYRAQKNYQYSKDLMNYQMQLQNAQMAEYWNKYNSPSAQMQAYREAGLNPNLVYGQSAQVSTPSVGTNSFSSPSVQHDSKWFSEAVNNVWNGIHHAEAQRVNDSIINKNNSDANLKEEKTATEEVVRAGKGLDNDAKRIENEFLADFWVKKLKLMQNQDQNDQWTIAMNRFNYILAANYAEEEKIITLQNMIKHGKLTEAQRDLVNKQIDDIQFKLDYLYPMQMRLTLSEIGLNGSMAGYYGELGKTESSKRGALYGENGYYPSLTDYNKKKSGLVTAQTYNQHLQNDWNNRMGYSAFSGYVAPLGSLINLIQKDRRGY